MNAPAEIERLARNPETCSLLGISAPTLARHVKSGLVPRPVKISLRAVGWPLSELRTIVAARIAGKTDDQIRTLVRQLEDGRRAAA